MQPQATLAGQVTDVRDAIAWVRAHAVQFGADSGTLFLAGSSAGAILAIRAVCDGETGIAGLICRYGYYGGLAPSGDLPPALIVHGEKDLISAADVRVFAERLRTASRHPVSYAELPGFDLYESIRGAAVSVAVEQFAAWVSAPRCALSRVAARPGPGISAPGLAATPRRRAAESSTEAGTCGNGSSEVCVLFVSGRICGDTAKDCGRIGQ